MVLREVGQQIRKARKHRGWSQAELGRRAGGLNKETINRIELGANTTFDSIVRIADALEFRTPWDSLFTTAATTDIVDQLDADERDLIEAWRSITPRAQQAMRALLQDLASQGARSRTRKKQPA